MSMTYYQAERIATWCHAGTMDPESIKRIQGGPGPFDLLTVAGKVSLEDGTEHWVPLASQGKHWKPPQVAPEDPDWICC